MNYKSIIVSSIFIILLNKTGWNHRGVFILSRQPGSLNDFQLLPQKINSVLALNVIIFWPKILSPTRKIIDQSRSEIMLRNVL